MIKYIIYFIIYAFILIINFIILRKLAIYEVYENFFDLVLSIFVSLFPIIHIFSFLYFANILILESKIPINDIAKKVLFFKWKKK
jgi:hypothetical protein